jgi:RNA polymerase sigma-70 factor (ECF subfamily)
MADTVQSTRETLLQRVRDPANQEAWSEFVRLYRPLLSAYARRCALKHDDAEEVAQECFDVLLRKMPDFRYAPAKGKFKNYLFKLVISRISNRFRKRRPRLAASGELRAAAAPGSTTTPQWDKEWLKRHLRFALERIETEFAEITIAAFKLYALQEWRVERVCDSLGMTANQVYLAKSRVTNRLREELERQLGDRI